MTPEPEPEPEPEHPESGSGDILESGLLARSAHQQPLWRYALEVTGLCCLWFISGDYSVLLLPVMLVHQSLWVWRCLRRWKTLAPVATAIFALLLALSMLAGFSLQPLALADLSLLLAWWIVPFLLARWLQSQLDQLEFLHMRLKRTRSRTRANTEFLASMSHELRTPLNGVQGVTAMLAEQSLPESARRLVNVVQQSADSLLYLVNDILDFSKIGAGKLHLDHQVFDLSQVTQDVLNLMQPLADDKGLRLDLDDQLGQEVRFIGDPVRIKQILFNIIGNALKFTSRGGVGVHLSYQELRESLCLVSIRVQDTGEGISEDKIPHLFEAYTQARQEHGAKGTGLGLMISRKLARLMWGDVSVHSRLGEGSEFTVTLKLEKTRLKLRQPRDHRQFGCGRKVLVAEDNAVNQMVVRSLLTKLGFEATVVENGQLAVEAYPANEWAAVILDLQMPVKDGYAAVREIRAAMKGGTQPVIALTATTSSSEHEAARQAGFDTVITKPIALQTLLECLNQQLRAYEAQHPNLRKRA